MSAAFIHIGIPVTNKKPGMTYNEDLILWATNPDDHAFKIEYLKFEEGTPMPEVLHRHPHVAYRVDCLEAYLSEADQMICGPMVYNPNGDRLAFFWKDGAVIELCEDA